MGKNVIISTLPNISQNYLPKVNTSNIFANSLVYDDGNSVLINTTTASAFRLDVNGTARTGALTLTGALSGTSATFSGLITANANITAAGLIYGRTTNNFPTSGLGYYAIKTNNIDAERGGITIQVSSATNTLTDALTINYTGAATFSSTLQSGVAGSGFSRMSPGSSTQSGYFEVFKGDGSTRLGYIGYNNTNFEFTAENNAKFIFTGANVGIGATSPGNKLAILGSDETTTPTLGTNAGKFGIFNGVGGGTYGIIMGVINNGNVYQQVQRIDGTGTAYNLLLQPSGGNVGIGTTSPSQKLSLGSPLGIPSTATTYGSNDQGSIMWSYEYTGIYPRHLDIIAAGSPDGTNGGSNIRFFTNTVSSGASATERMRITSGGNVGINTTTPNLTSYGGRVLTISGVNMGAGYEAAIELEANLTSNDRLGEIAFINSAASSPKRLAFIECQRVDNNNAGFLRFATKDGTTLAERLRITSGGSVVAGDTSSTPTGTNNAAHLWIPSQNRMYISSTGSAATFSRASSGGTGTIMGFDYNGGAVGNISTNGSTITFSGTALSDERYKENIEVITNALDAINSVEWVSFNYKENNKKSAGVIAQQLKNTSLSDYVIDGIDNESYKAVDYNAIIGYLGKAIQELKSENDTLKADIESLKALINK